METIDAFALSWWSKRLPVSSETELMETESGDRVLDRIPAPRFFGNGINGNITE